MSIFSRFENKMEDTFDTLGDKLFDSPISPVQIAKKAEKIMRREKMVGAGKQYAPTLYTVLVNPSDDQRLFGYYPTLAGETETYLKAKASEAGLTMDGDPLVRFFADEDLKRGKFDIMAEAVASDIVSQLREEEMERYGIKNKVPQQQFNNAPQQTQQPQQAQQPQQNIVDNYVSPFSAEVPVSNSQFDANLQSQVQDSPVVVKDPVPNLKPAVQQPPAPVPNQVPLNQENQGSAYQANQGYQNSNMVNDDNVYKNQMPQSSAKTAVFAGGFDVSPSSSQNNSIAPKASLQNLGTGQVFSINSANVIIGRENSCNIVLPDVNASRQHAQITFNQGMWLISDLGSTNGTYVNNQEITTREIKNGDVVTIGVTNLGFSLQ